VLVVHRDYYQMDIEFQEGFVTPWAPCDPVFFGGQDVDNSKAYHEFAGTSAGSSIGVSQSSFFKTEAGVLWNSITGPWCASLKTPQDTLDFSGQIVIPEFNASDPCVRTKRNSQGTPAPAITISYEYKINLGFSMLP
jgi:hypothetical protein